MVYKISDKNMVMSALSLLPTRKEMNTRETIKYYDMYELDIPDDTIAILSNPNDEADAFLAYYDGEKIDVGAISGYQNSITSPDYSTEFSIPYTDDENALRAIVLEYLIYLSESNYVPFGGNDSNYSDSDWMLEPVNPHNKKLCLEFIESLMGLKRTMVVASEGSADYHSYFGAGKLFYVYPSVAVDCGDFVVTTMVRTMLYNTYFV